MKISRPFWMFLERHTIPRVADAGACRYLLYTFKRNLGRRLLNLNDIDTSLCNEPSL